MKALVDNDFLNHLVGKKIPVNQPLEEVIKTIFEGLGVEAYMHELVKEHELVLDTMPPGSRKVVISLFQKDYIKIAFLNKILSTEAQKDYYIKMFMDIYYEFKGELPFEEKKILTEWRRGKSLGEVHSLTMCLVDNFGIFLSDDDDSRKLKAIIEDKFSVKIEVFDRRKALDRVSKLENKRIERKVRRALESDKNN